MLSLFYHVLRHSQGFFYVCKKEMRRRNSAKTAEDCYNATRAKKGEKKTNIRNLKSCINCTMRFVQYFFVENCSLHNKIVIKRDKSSISAILQLDYKFRETIANKIQASYNEFATNDSAISTNQSQTAWRYPMRRLPRLEWVMGQAKRKVFSQREAAARGRRRLVRCKFVL